MWDTHRNEEKYWREHLTDKDKEKSMRERKMSIPMLNYL